MKRHRSTVPLLLIALAVAVGATALGARAAAPARPAPAAVGVDDAVDRGARALLVEGRRVFRYDTFGSEAFWGGKLRLHEAIEGQALGGVGQGVSPKAALALGLKVDSAALPAAVVAGIKNGSVSLDKPETTVALLKLNAVLGVTGTFDAGKTHLTGLGIQCALCHSTVDDSFAPGIGRRLDGWPNRDLNVGAIVASAPSLKPYEELLGVDDAAVRGVLKSWGPGRYDAELDQDGKATRPDGKSAATLLPAAFGLAGVNLHTYNGWGSVTYWNAYVAVTQMHGQGNFSDPRLGISIPVGNTMVADVHRTLIKGGIFMYPGTTGKPAGKLRLMYECNPFAFIVEVAGGKATNGVQRILDIQPEHLHQRTPIFIGSENMVQECLSYLKTEERE